MDPLKTAQELFQTTDPQKIADFLQRYGHYLDMLGMKDVVEKLGARFDALVKQGYGVGPKPSIAMAAAAGAVQGAGEGAKNVLEFFDFFTPEKPGGPRKWNLVTVLMWGLGLTATVVVGAAVLKR